MQEARSGGLFRLARPEGVPGDKAPPGWRRWGRAAAVIALCTGVSELLAPHFDLSNIIMVYLAGVAYIAVHEGLRVSVAAVVASIFLFDLIYVPPRWGLNPLNPKHFFTFAVMLAVGLLISRLASSARRQAELAEGRAHRARALSALAESLASARTREAVAAVLAQSLQATYGASVRLQDTGADAGDGTVVAVAEATEDALAITASPAVAAALAAEDRELLAAFAHQGGLALERCRLEESTARAQSQAEAERVRSTLLAAISHDVRTPLTTIIGAATTLQAQDARLPPGERRELAGGIAGEAQRLHSLVSDLLDLTRLEAGSVALQPEWCPADDLVGEALNALGGRTASHALVLDIPADAIVWCDPRLVEHALLNLVDNAVRHTPTGTRIHVAVATGAQEWQLQVSDEGGGFPPGQEQEMFLPFRQGSTARGRGGTGLGLAICAAVARAHGGRIAASSAGGGARITLSLPQPPHGPLPGEPA